MTEWTTPIEELKTAIAKVNSEMDDIATRRNAISKNRELVVPSKGAQVPSKFAETEFWAQLLLMGSLLAGWLAEYLPTDVAAYAMTASTFGYAVYRQMSKGRMAAALAQQQLQGALDDGTAYAIQVDLEDVAGQADSTDARVESLEKQLAGLRRDLAQRTDGDHRDADSGNPKLNGQVGGPVSESVVAPDGP